MPQIVKIVQARSVEGLSLAANAAELVAYSITFAYNWRLGYPLSTYGELLSCWAQDVVLVGLLLFFRGVLGKRAVAAAAAYGLLLWALLGGTIGGTIGGGGGGASASAATTAAAAASKGIKLVSMELLTALQASTIFIVALGGRLPQILLNARRGDSGQLSAATSALNLAGNAARVFTTVVLTGDFLNLAGALVQAGLNGTLLAQCVMTARRRGAGAGAAKKEEGGDGAGAAATGAATAVSAGTTTTTKAAAAAAVAVDGGEGESDDDGGAEVVPTPVLGLAS